MINEEQRQPPRTTPRPPWDFSPPELDDIVHTHKLARYAHRMLSDHLVMVGDHDPEPRRRYTWPAGHWDRAPVHARFGPSDASRWLECSGTGPQGARLPKVRTSAHRNKEEAARLQALVVERLGIRRCWPVGENE